MADKGGSKLGESTSWSLIHRAQGSGAEARAALGELIGRYERTVLALIRALGYPPSSSPEDLKQEFFTQLLSRNDFHKLDSQRGHFRGWLRRSVKNFLSNVWQESRRLKRGNSLTGPLQGEYAHDVTPETLYLRAFAEDTLLHVLQRHRAEARDKQRFDVLSRFLPGPQLSVEQLASVASELGSNRVAVATALFHLKSRYKELLCEAIADTLLFRAAEGEHPPDPREVQAEIDREVRLLYRCLAESDGTFTSSEAE